MSSSLEAGERVWMHAPKKTERTYRSSKRNTEAKLFDTFNNKKNLS